MKTMKLCPYVTASIIAVSLWPRPGLAASCTLSPVTTWYNTVFAGPYRLEFDRHDPHGPHPDRWLADAGFRIVQPNGKICRVSSYVAIVTLPIYIAAGRILYIDTYSGSENIVVAVDARTCKTLGRTPQWVGGGFLPTKYGFYIPGIGPMTLTADCRPDGWLRRPPTE